jgi:hypothetical protein
MRPSVVNTIVQPRQPTHDSTLSRSGGWPRSRRPFSGPRRYGMRSEIGTPPAVRKIRAGPGRIWGLPPMSRLACRCDSRSEPDTWRCRMTRHRSRSSCSYALNLCQNRVTLRCPSSQRAPKSLVSARRERRPPVRQAGLVVPGSPGVGGDSRREQAFRQAPCGDWPSASTPIGHSYSPCTSAYRGCNTGAFGSAGSPAQVCRRDIAPAF